MPDQYTSSPSCPNNTGVPGYSTGPSKNLPTSPIGSSGSIFYATAPGNGWSNNADVTNQTNYYAIVPGSSLQTIMTWGRYGLNNGSSTDAPAPAVTSSDLLALDQKMDDGIATSGNVISGWVWSGSNIMAFSLGGCNNNAGIYQVQNSGYQCTPLIRIGAQVGDPQ